MKLSPSTPSHARAGITLIECLAYISTLLVIAGVAFNSLGRLWAVTGRLAGVTDDLRDSTRSGEQWRADVRAAHGPIRIEEGGLACVIETTNGPVIWFHGAGSLWRRAGDLEPSCWLRRVETCQFNPDPRTHVAALQLNVQLMPRSRQSRQPSAFTFLAVPTAPIAVTP